MADAKQIKIVKGMKVREKPQQELFEGIVTEFRVDGETGDVQYKVTRQIFNEDGSPKMVDDQTGDCLYEKNEDGTDKLNEQGHKIPTGEMTNVRVTKVPVYEEKFFTREQIDYVPE